MPAVLNNAIDWLSRPFGTGAIKGKPFGVVGATPTPYGGKWAHADTARSAGIAGAIVVEDVTVSQSALEVDVLTDPRPSPAWSVPSRRSRTSSRPRRRLTRWTDSPYVLGPRSSRSSAQTSGTIAISGGVVEQVLQGPSHDLVAVGGRGDALEPEADQQRPRRRDRGADREAGGVGDDPVVAVGGAAGRRRRRSSSRRVLSRTTGWCRRAGSRRRRRCRGSGCPSHWRR